MYIGGVRYDAIAINRLQYSVNIALICTGNPPSYSDLSYCDVCSTVVV